MRPRNFKSLSKRVVAADVVYLIILVYLVVYSILNGLYLMLPEANPSFSNQPLVYDIPDTIVTPVSCSFHSSSQYQQVSRVVCYFLLVVTIIIRNHDWLAVGAAASVMTYSGVVAIHMIVLFATNNRFHLPAPKTLCVEIPTPTSESPFFACQGILEPDYGSAFSIVSTCLLAALPIAAWSTTFRSSRSKPILLCWLLILAIAHIFFNITQADVNRHFQICPAGRPEALPGGGYQTPDLNSRWIDQFSSLMNPSESSSNALQSSDIASPCLYSCFTTAGYIGRTYQDVGIYEYSVSDSGPQVRAQQRFLGILMWSVYTFLAILTLLTTEKTEKLPHWMHTKYSVRIAPSWSQQKYTARKFQVAHTTLITVRRICTKWIVDLDRNRLSELYSNGHAHISLLNITQLFTQSLGIAAFLGSLIRNEMASNTYAVLEAEPFSAVGQWGVLLVLVLILCAAALGRIWEGSRRGTSASSYTHARPSGDPVEHKLDEEEEWNCEVGYAS